MKTETLDCIGPLLAVLRAYEALSEVRPTVFHLQGKDFIHFHEAPDGVFADVRLAKGQVRMPATTPQGQSELLERIEATLSTVELHAAGKRGGKSKGRA
ncbi:MAG TPA: hypothetical protein VNO35_33995 [Steroidobacteraceae bacterium]|nr:hypothetical protein [Steroidobacteraceae bacterium]